MEMIIAVIAIGEGGRKAVVVVVGAAAAAFAAAFASIERHRIARS